MRTITFKKLSILVIFTFLLVSCIIPNPSTPVSAPSDPRIQVNENSFEAISFDEIVRINNCGNPAYSEQTKDGAFTTIIEGAAELGISIEVVEASISGKYGQYRSASTTQKLTAAPNTNMEFILRWSEEVRAGNVIINGKIGTYDIRIPIAVEQVSSRDLGCATSPSTSLVTPATLPQATPIFSPIQRVAVAVGVTDQTTFSTQNANSYPVTAWVSTVDEAIAELRKHYANNDIVYVVHVPELQITPGNPGSCKLSLDQVTKLRQYPLGWIIGGDHIIPDEFKISLSYCYSNTQSSTCPSSPGVGYLISSGYFNATSTITGPAALHPFEGSVELAKVFNLQSVPRWGINIPAGMTIPIPENITLLNNQPYARKVLMKYMPVIVM